MLQKHVRFMGATPCSLQDSKDLLLTSQCQIPQHFFRSLKESRGKAVLATGKKTSNISANSKYVQTVSSTFHLNLNLVWNKIEEIATFYKYPAFIIKQKRKSGVLHCCILVQRDRLFPSILYFHNASLRTLKSSNTILDI